MTEGVAPECSYLRSKVNVSRNKAEWLDVINALCDAVVHTLLKTVVHIITVGFFVLSCTRSKGVISAY